MSHPITVADLVRTVIDVSGKTLRVHYVPGPVGVRARNFSKERIKSIGWQAKVSLREGIARTYAWIWAQLAKQGRAQPPVPLRVEQWLK